MQDEGSNLTYGVFLLVFVLPVGSYLFILFFFCYCLQLPSFVTRQSWVRTTDYRLTINETMENISYTVWDSSSLCSFPINHKDTQKAQKAVWRVKNKPLYFLPAGCSIQCVMEDQSLEPAGGLLQPLAEPHTNKWAWGIMCNQNLYFGKAKSMFCLTCDMCNYGLLTSCKSRLSLENCKEWFILFW